MRSILSLISLFLFVLIVSAPAQAQVEAGAAWQVLRYDISASVQADRSLSAHAVVSVRNVGRGAGARITLRISPKAEIKAAAFNDTVASFRPSQDERANQQKVEVTLASTIAPGDSFNSPAAFVTFKRKGAVSAPRGTKGLVGVGYQKESGRNCAPRGVMAASPLFSATGKV
jgi:hypothetical protein